MLWDLDPQNKSLKEKKVFFQNYIVILDQSYFRFFELETLPILPKPKFRISSELASIKAELAKRRAAGAFEKNISLANRFAKPGVSYSDEEIQETLREIRSQWEEDLDDLNGQG